MDKIKTSKENITFLPPDIRREFVNFIVGRENKEGEGDDLGEATAE